MRSTHTTSPRGRVLACRVRLAAADLSFRLALRWGSAGRLGLAARRAENAAELLLDARFCGGALGSALAAETDAAAALLERREAREALGV